MDWLNLKPGDIIAFSGKGALNAFINLATFGVPGVHASHVGIVAEYGDTLYLFESTTVNAGGIPCRITGSIESGVRAAAIDDIIKRPGRIYHYPLRRTLTPFARYRLTRYLESMLGVRYDLRGAAKAGGFILRSLLSVLRPGNLSEIFCSELTGAAHDHAGVLDIPSPWIHSPNSFVRMERRNAVLLSPRRIK